MFLRIAFAFILTASAPAAARDHEAKMSWLDNGTIRLGVDLALGGAITWLSRSGSEENVINSHDWGRQVQMSYYSGPVPFIVGDTRPAKHREHIGWNPIQAGDDFGHGSRVLAHRNDGRTLYVKCIPMQWPLNDVPGDCTFECWFELDGAAVRARCRLNNARTDHAFYAARGQELPAVYTNRPYHRMMTYTGERPFTGEPAEQLKTGGPVEGWSMWLATENWSALVNDAGWGVGVWNPDCVRFGGGYNGTPGAGGAKSAECGYIAPGRDEILDHNIAHEYRYELVLGTVEEIRAHVVRRSAARTLPAWKFERDRQGWHYRNASDQGWPVRGELNVRFDTSDPSLVSSHFACRAEDMPMLVLDAAFTTSEREAQVFWSTAAEAGFVEKRSLRFPIVGDGERREVRVRLGDSPEYRGLIVQLRLDPVNEAGGSMRLHSVRFERGL
jgi:hypothetical protein